MGREVDGIVHDVRHVLTHPRHPIGDLPCGIVDGTVGPQFLIASGVEIHGTVDVEGEVRTRVGGRCTRLPCCAAARGNVHEGWCEVCVGGVDEHVVFRNVLEVTRCFRADGDVDRCRG